ncbi:MAG: purine-binding chemotaxis protein CheW [Nitrospirae bacterium]|nr:purine-binding chemotaxis protein CheW [Nitrospirota bacterium]
MMAKDLQLVVFKIGREFFGVGIDAVREIVRFQEITSVPDAPFFLEGVMNLRGRIVAVVNLGKRLRLLSAQRSKAARVLITESGGNMIGLNVDSVSEVLKVRPEAVEGPPEMVSAIGVEYIIGVAKVDERLIILLDLKKILAIEELIKVEEVVFKETENRAA